jgi:hypothetical protein
MQLDDSSLRRLKFVRVQFFPAASAQNMKRLVRFLTNPTEPVAVNARKAHNNSTHFYSNYNGPRQSWSF